MAIYKKGYYDLYMFQGDTGNIRVNGIPETADYSVYFELRSMDGTSMLREPIVVQSKHKSSIVIGLPAYITDDIPPGTYCYAIKLCLNKGEYVSEETVIPPLKNTGTSPTTFKNKALFLIYPKQIEGDTW